jgi:DNA-binding XRE family transcriptional regulator
MNNLPATIKKLRKQKGFSQKSMSERLNMARTTYTKLETGNTALDYDRLVSISKILDVPLFEIVKNDDNVYKSITEELSSMVCWTFIDLCERLVKVIPYSRLAVAQKQLLEQKGLAGKVVYENTPLGGRLYDFGPRDVFRTMMDNGMDVLFKRGLVTEDWLVNKWKGCRDTDVEVDCFDYFVVFLVELKMPDGKTNCVQIAERDLPAGVNEDYVEKYLRDRFGALDAELMCWTDTGYSPVDEIVS